MDSFEGKLAVVTGGGSGIGRELVVQLAAQGCSVAVCDLDATAAEETLGLAASGAPHGVRLTACTCDVTDEAAVDRFRDEVLAQHGTDYVNLLFNNAGIAGAGSFIGEDRAAWERVFDVCWGGVYNCARAFMPALIASDEACLVNTSSVLGFWANTPLGVLEPCTAYATAKFAVKGFSEALVEDLRLNAPHVRVVLVMPGIVGTPMTANSARVLGRDEEGLGDALAALGLSVDDLSGDDIRRLAAIEDEVFNEFGPTSASSAAAIVLEAIGAGRWRVLVGDDAHELDQAVRADPEGAYERNFSGLPLPPWFMPMLLLRGGFDSRRDPELAATFELRFREERIAIRVAGGELEAVRGKAATPDAVLDVDPQTMGGLVAGEETLGEAERRGSLTLTGDRAKVERFLSLFPNR